MSARRPMSRRSTARVIAVVVASASIGTAAWLGQSDAATVSTSFTATADAYVRSDSPSKNYGVAKELILRASPVARSYMRFEVSGLSGNVSKATLRLYANDGSTVGYEVRPVSVNGWGEKTITYANAPAPGAVVASSGPFSAGANDIDVTSLVTGNGTISLALTTTGGTEIGIASREARTAPAPQLIVETAQPPDTTITSGPTGSVASTSASFGFSASESGSTFECSLDGAAFSSCASPKSYTGLSDGQHTFSVRSIDPAGTIDPTPATRTWTVDRTAPETTIESGPSGTTQSDSAAFSFSSSESGSTFECSLDGATFSACSSPKSYAGLGDGQHTFAVRAIDATGNVDSSPASRTWTLDATGPGTTIDSGATGIVASASASFAFSSDESGATFECSLDGAAFSTCSSPKDYVGLADGQHTFRVRAVDVLGNADQTPASRTWTVDTIAPQTTLGSGPSGTVASDSASFGFSSSEGGSSFECSLDGAAFSPCSSPKGHSGLADGPHTFRVRATDAAGNVDSSPASRTWTVDLTAPDTTIDSGPSGTLGSASASFGFSSSETGSSFECRLDAASFAPCSSPQDYTGLADGQHTFRVRAIDGAGNVDETPASRTWTTDAAAPETTLGSGPSGTVTDGSANFSFSASEAGSSFECQLDAAAFATCSSPKAYSGLADGQHTFRVRAVDGAGNIDQTPASRTWTIDSGAPETTIASAPSGTYRLGSADFDFSSSEAGATYQCSLDGAAFSSCSASPTFDVANGSHELRVRAIDASGNSDPTPAQDSWWADALLLNGNFETPTAGWADQGYTVPGWTTFGATVSAVSGGAAGSIAGRVTASGGGTAGIYTSPRPINATVAGTTYTVRGSVRSQSPGKSVCLRVREWSGGTVVGSAQSCRSTTGSWVAFAPVTYTIASTGNEVDVQVYQSNSAAAGDNFDVDGLSLSTGTPTVPSVPQSSGDPVLLAAGDIASCWSSGDEAVSRLLDTMAGTVAEIGDTEQNHGRADEYAGCYDPSWGRHKARTRPAIGDHEYGTSGAAPYWDYFGAAAGERGKGWYSYDRGDWHIVVLNSNCDLVGGCAAGSEQYEWLQDDLERNAGDCVGAYFHHPLYSAGGLHGGYPRVQPFWDLLYQYRAEWVLGGNDHNYQRFAPQTPDGAVDQARGVRQFVVGTGGTQHYTLNAPLANTEVQNDTAFGVLRLTLHSGSYDWRFVPQEGRSFTDSGTRVCSPRGDTTAPETTIDSGPSGISQSGSASLTFSSNEAGAAFQCSLDGASFAACASPKAYSGLADGDHAFRVRAVDDAGNVDISPATRTWTAANPIPSGSLLTNGSFESSLTGWTAFNSSVSLAGGGPVGQNFAHVAYTSGSGSYSIFPTVRPVRPPTVGATYTAGGWVRSDVPGKNVCLRFREWSGSSQVGAAQTCRTATTSWVPFNTVSYTSVGGDSLEIVPYQSNPVAGDAFDVDGLRLLGP